MNLTSIMKTRSRTLPWLAVALLSLSQGLRADEAKPPLPAPSDRGFMVSAGLGPADSGVVGVVSIAARRRSKLVEVRVASASRFELFGDSPTPSNTEYSLLFGRYQARRAGYTSASAGLSVVSSLRRGRLLSTDCVFLFGCSGRYARVVKRTVGIPFEAKAVLSSRFAGLGVGIVGTVSPKGSFVGVGLTVELGRLR